MEHRQSAFVWSSLQSRLATMEHRRTGHTLPADAASGDAMIDMGPDKSVLILLKHCREMKQQETHLRLFTLLLLLGCSALLIFIICADLRCEKSSSGQGMNTVIGDGVQLEKNEKSPAYSKQERVYPTVSQTNSNRLRIDLISKSDNNMADPRYIRWIVVFGEKYNEEKSAIVIPEDGFYFVYVRIILACHDDEVSNFQRFNMTLHKWNKKYDNNESLMDAMDGITCTPEGQRSVFVGQLFNLLKGDHVSVWIGEGYKLISTSVFGAYLA